MRTIIAGSRGVRYEHVCLAMALWAETVTEAVSGTCRGADMHGELWASVRGIPIKRFRPDWSGQGKAAGPIRNREMAEYSDALVAVWDGKSAGTANMIYEAKKRGLVVFIHRTDK